jgi:hypothetical protein
VTFWHIARAPFRSDTGMTRCLCDQEPGFGLDP